MDVGGVEDVAQFVAGQAVELGVVGVEFGAQQGTALGIPREGRAVVAEVAGEGCEVVGGVGEFEDAGDDEVEICGGVVVGWD